MQSCLLGYQDNSSHIPRPKALFENMNGPSYLNLSCQLTLDARRWMPWTFYMSLLIKQIDTVLFHLSCTTDVPVVPAWHGDRERVRNVGRGAEMGPMGTARMEPWFDLDSDCRKTEYGAATESNILYLYNIVFCLNVWLTVSPPPSLPSHKHTAPAFIYFNSLMELKFKMKWDHFRMNIFLP